jgi:hypothetical protein
MDSGRRSEDGEAVIKVVDSKWYNHNGHCIGIVLVETDFGHKAYIGVGYGNDEAFDATRIVSNGARFREAPALWPKIDLWAT